MEKVITVMLMNDESYDCCGFNDEEHFPYRISTGNHMSCMIC